MVLIFLQNTKHCIRIDNVYCMPPSIHTYTYTRAMNGAIIHSYIYAYMNLYVICYMCSYLHIMCGHLLTPIQTLSHTWSFSIWKYAVASWLVSNNAFMLTLLLFAACVASPLVALQSACKDFMASMDCVVILSSQEPCVCLIIVGKGFCYMIIRGSCFSWNCLLASKTHLLYSSLSLVCKRTRVGGATAEPQLASESTANRGAGLLLVHRHPALLFHWILDDKLGRCEQLQGILWASQGRPPIAC